MDYELEIGHLRNRVTGLERGVLSVSREAEIRKDEREKAIRTIESMLRNAQGRSEVQIDWGRGYDKGECAAYEHVLSLLKVRGAK